MCTSLLLLTREKRWGEKTKESRIFKKKENEKILKQYIAGQSIRHLAEEFFLSDSSIKKIVYKKDK